MTSKNGFTVTELLVAAAIFMVVLAALGGLFVSSSNAYRVNERVSDRQQETEAAFQLLNYEIGLAGYKGTLTAHSLSGLPLTISKGSSDALPDAVQIRYYEDRYTTGERHVTFDIDSSAKTLRRREGSASAQVIVTNVANLKVVHYIRRNGLKVDAARGVTPPTDLAGLNMELTFVDGSLWRFPIGLNNSPQATAN